MNDANIFHNMSREDRRLLLISAIDEVPEDLQEEALSSILAMLDRERVVDQTIWIRYKTNLRGFPENRVFHQEDF